MRGNGHLRGLRERRCVLKCRACGTRCSGVNISWLSRDHGGRVRSSHEHERACECVGSELHFATQTPLQRVTVGLGWRLGVRTDVPRHFLESAFGHLEERLQALAALPQNHHTRQIQQWLGRWQRAVDEALAAGTSDPPAPVAPT